MNRRDFLKRSSVAAGALAFPGMWAPAAHSAAPKILIVDMDMGMDIDDAADLDMIGVLARRHNFRLIGAISCAATNYGCPVLRAQVDFRQLPGVTYGKYTGSAVTGIADVWGAALSAQYRGGETDASGGYAQGVAVYQDLLTNSADGSVTIIATGFASVLADLLRASGGVALVTAKVAELIWVAGMLPGPTVEPWNVVRDNIDAQYLTNNWPSAVPLTWCGIELGDSGLWNRPPLGANPNVNPAKFAFDNSYPGHLDASGAKPATYRWSWSAPGMLHAAFPGVYTSYAGTGGKVTIDGSSVTTWTTPGGGASQRYLQLKSGVTTTYVNAVLDELMNAPTGAYPAAVLSSGTLKSNATVKVQ